MTVALETLVLASSPTFVVTVRLHAKMFGITAAQLVRGAVKSRLSDRSPTAIEWEHDGARTAKLKFEVLPDTKRQIELAAEREGLSISRWLERAICDWALAACEQSARESLQEWKSMTAHVETLRLHMVDQEIA